MGEQSYGIDPAVATQIAKDVSEIQAMGVETAIVIGGGNIFRGLAASARGMDRATEMFSPSFAIAACTAWPMVTLGSRIDG